MTWGNRKQHFQWVNEIEYCYGGNDKKKITVHVVVCEEIWKQVNASAEVEVKTSKHARISSKPLNRENVHEHCNPGARNRRGTETGILVEKRHGFHYEHCFSYDRNAMRGYHYLMRTGHLFIILAQYSECPVKKVKQLGTKGFIRFVRETMAGPWLEYNMVIKWLNRNFQLRLVQI